MRWIPWSSRQSPELAREYLRPRPGVPEGVLSIMLDFVLGYFFIQDFTQRVFLDREKASQYVRAFHESIPMDSERAARHFSDNREQLIDAFDFILSGVSVEGFGNPQLIKKLNSELEEARSEFVIRPSRMGAHELQLRVDPVTSSLIDDLLQSTDRATSLMSQAWSKLYSRFPDPTGAVLAAVKALEVIAAPIVTPLDDTPSLGKIAECLKVKPEKWSSVVEGTRLVQRISDDLKFIWDNQKQSRHGHPQNEIEVSSQTAEILLQMALCNLELLRRGAIAPVDLQNLN